MAIMPTMIVCTSITYQFIDMLLCHLLTLKVLVDESMPS